MPVIMMSGHATIDTAVEATRIGAQSFLEKPITLQKLLKAVEQGPDAKCRCAKAGHDAVGDRDGADGRGGRHDWGPQPAPWWKWGPNRASF